MLALLIYLGLGNDKLIDTSQYLKALYSEPEKQLSSES